MRRPAFHTMTLRELSDWVTAHDTLGFDSVQIDDLDDDEELAAREELEAIADEIFSSQGWGASG